jgi:uncharacterized protein (DUF2236 family)
MEETHAGGALHVTDEARAIARAVLDAPGGPWGETVRLLSAGLLPEPLRNAYGLPWDGARERELEALQERVRASRRAGPASVDGRGEAR